MPFVRQRLNSREIWYTGVKECGRMQIYQDKWNPVRIMNAVLGQALFDRNETSVWQNCPGSRR